MIKPGLLYVLTYHFQPNAPFQYYVAGAVTVVVMFSGWGGAGDAEATRCIVRWRVGKQNVPGDYIYKIKMLFEKIS